MLYVFICGLFYDACSVTETIAWNGSVMIGKDLERSSCGLILRYYPDICPEGLRKTTKNLRTTGLRAKIWTRELPKMKQVS
jgi:hypothetical protein